MNYREVGTVADSNCDVAHTVAANTVAANTAPADVVVADNSMEYCYMNMWRIAAHRVLATLVMTKTWSNRLDRSAVPQTSRTVLRSGP